MIGGSRPGGRPPFLWRQRKEIKPKAPLPQRRLAPMPSLRPPRPRRNSPGGLRHRRDKSRRPRAAPRRCSSGMPLPARLRHCRRHVAPSPWGAASGTIRRPGAGGVQALVFIDGFALVACLSAGGSRRFALTGTSTRQFRRRGCARREGKRCRLGFAIAGGWRHASVAGTAVGNDSSPRRRRRLWSLSFAGGVLSAGGDWPGLARRASRRSTHGRQGRRRNGGSPSRAQTSTRQFPPAAGCARRCRGKALPARFRHCRHRAEPMFALSLSVRHLRPGCGIRKRLVTPATGAIRGGAALQGLRLRSAQSMASRAQGAMAAGLSSASSVRSSSPSKSLAVRLPVDEAFAARVDEGLFALCVGLEVERIPGLEGEEQIVP